MTRILGIDPGSQFSTYVIWDGVRLEEFQELSNKDMLFKLRMLCGAGMRVDACAIEQIRGFGLQVGNETLDTCWWSGRFFHEFGGEGRSHMLPRKAIVNHLCGNGQAGDKFVRDALLERFGGPGSVKRGGPLYGVAKHAWAALAVAVTWYDLHGGAPTAAAAEELARAGRVG